MKQQNNKDNTDIGRFLAEFGISARKQQIKWKSVIERKFPDDKKTGSLEKTAELTDKEITCTCCKIC